MADIPPPPPGFTMDSEIPPPPQGFTLDTPKELPKAPEAPSLTTGESIGYTALGAVKEVGNQAVGAGKALGNAAMSMIPGTPQSEDMTRLRNKQYTPEEQATAKSDAEAVKHPLDATRAAISGWIEKVLPTPTTPQQAQERGAGLVRGAEAVIPAGGAVRDLAGLAARPLERAAAPLAEKIAAKGESKASTAAAAAQEKNDLIRDVRKLKLRLTSQDIGAPIGKRVEAVASRPQLEREISLGNASRVKEAAAADVGIKEPLSWGSVQKAITETLPTYRSPRSLGRVDLAKDPQWQKDIEGVRETSAQEMKDFPADINQKLEDEIKTFNVASADADSIVTKIAKLRARASANFSAGGAEEVELASAQRKIASAMEDAIERHGEATGRGDVIKGFRDARQKLAKLYTIRDSLTTTGELDLRELEKRLDKGEPLTGNLRTLARAKSAFDRSFQNPENVRGHPVGAGDIALGLIAGGGKGAAAGGLPGMVVGAGAVAARPAARFVMGSSPYQKAFIKPRVPKPSLVSRAARNIADAGRPPPNTLSTLEPKKKLKVKVKRQTLQDSETGS